jgi:hypothetical protein
MPRFCVLEERAPRGRSEMVVIADVFPADVALDIPAARADHLVATRLFHELCFASVTLSQHCLCPRLLERVLRIFFLASNGVFARHGNVRDFITKPAADLLALWVQAAEFAFFLDRWRYRFEVAERAFVQSLYLCISNVFLLLERL